MAVFPTAAGGGGRGGARRRAAGACALWWALALAGCSVAPEDIRYRDSRQWPAPQVPEDLSRPMVGSETAIPALPGRVALEPRSEVSAAERGDAIERPPAMIVE